MRSMQAWILLPDLVQEISDGRSRWHSGGPGHLPSGETNEQTSVIGPDVVIPPPSWASWSDGMLSFSDHFMKATWYAREEGSGAHVPSWKVGFMQKLSDYIVCKGEQNH